VIEIKDKKLIASLFVIFFVLGAAIITVSTTNGDSKIDSSSNSEKQSFSQVDLHNLCGPSCPVPGRYDSPFLNSVFL
jgi:hypothetical protein